MVNSPIQFECLKCGQGVVAENDQCGEQLPCPNCTAILVVPPKSIDASLFDDIFESLRESKQEVSNPKPASLSVKPVASEQQEPPQRQPNQAAVVPKPSSVKDESTAARKAERQAVVGQTQSSSAVVPSPAAETKATASIKRPLESNPPPLASQPAAKTENTHPHPTIESNDLAEISSDEGSVTPESVVESYLASVSIPEPVESQALKIDGLEFEDLNHVLTVKCRICDSLIHTNMAQAGQEVECPVCFSSVVVSEANIRKAVKKDFVNARETRLSIETQKNKSPSEPEEDPMREFSLAPLPVEKPTKMNVVAERKPTANSAHAPTSSSQAESVRDDKTSTFEGATPNSSAPPKKSRRELYEAAQRKLREGEQGARPKGIRPKGEKATTDAETNSQEFIDEVSSFDLIKEMLSHATTIAMLAIATVIITIGSLLMSFLEIGDGDTMTWLKNVALWFVFGAIPYTIGTLFLWYVGGRLFREAALGNRKVDSWKIASFTDFLSTFLLLGFSLLVAGIFISPIPMMYPFVSPLRFTVAPLLLVAVWYNQNPLAIIGLDAFKNFREEVTKWGLFYYPVVGLALLAFFGGLLLWVPIGYGGFITNPVGAAIVVFATASFAIVTGRHCGEVVNNLKPKSRKGLRKKEDEASIALAD